MRTYIATAKWNWMCTFVHTSIHKYILLKHEYIQTNIYPYMRTYSDIHPFRSNIYYSYREKEACLKASIVGNVVCAANFAVVVTNLAELEEDCMGVHVCVCVRERERERERARVLEDF